AGTTDDGSFYLSFGLGSSDSLFLFWGLIVVDELAWKSGDAPSGYSFGRFPDGTGPACTLIPTRYGKNREMIKSSLLINEIVATPAGGGMDWIELYNSGEDPMYLEDYSIVDDNPLHEPVNLPDVILGPGEFFVILATSIDSGDGSFFMPYGLNPSDSVTIYKGADIMDVLDWDDGDAPEGYSFGRLPDGASNCQTLIPTPGEPNQGV
ncbi:lamin tail domain-containing protein, partial [bacterium]|nr:lamin tail domain-containing protein [bacterium]